METYASIRERDSRGRFVIDNSPISDEQRKLRNQSYQEKYNEHNKERIKEFKRKWAKRNQNISRKWNADNLERVRSIKRKYKATHPDARLASNLRTRIVMALKNKNLTKQNKTADLIGCNVFELKAHIEKQFKRGMTWDNRGLYGWHIDHIKPIVLFDLSSIEGQKEAFHYKNLQPLWAKDNLVKKDKYV